MTKTLHYIFDPLCCWCYGAVAAVKAVDKAPNVALRLLPSGLFSAVGARPMDEDFAAYAWSNDQRIAGLTGQRFSERYRSEVLADRQQRFDSGPATLALSAVSLSSPAHELEALEAIQQARYVEGQDITRPDTLARLLEGLGLEAAAAGLLHSGAELLAANRARIESAQTLLSQFGARGVPSFVLESDGRLELLQSGTLYADPQAFAAQIAKA